MEAEGHINAGYYASQRDEEDESCYIDMMSEQEDDHNLHSGDVSQRLFAAEGSISCPPPVPTRTPMMDSPLGQQDGQGKGAAGDTIKINSFRSGGKVHFTKYPSSSALLGSSADDLDAAIEECSQALETGTSDEEREYLDVEEGDPSASTPDSPFTGSSPSPSGTPNKQVSDVDLQETARLLEKVEQSSVDPTGSHGQSATPAMEQKPAFQQQLHQGLPASKIASDKTQSLDLARSSPHQHRQHSLAVPGQGAPSVPQQPRPLAKSLSQSAVGQQKSLRAPAGRPPMPTPAQQQQQPQQKQQLQQLQQQPHTTDPSRPVPQWPGMAPGKAPLKKSKSTKSVTSRKDPEPLRPVGPLLAPSNDGTYYSTAGLEPVGPVQPLTNVEGYYSAASLKASQPLYENTGVAAANARSREQGELKPVGLDLPTSAAGYYAVKRTG